MAVRSSLFRTALAAGICLVAALAALYVFQTEDVKVPSTDIPDTEVKATENSEETERSETPNDLSVPSIMSAEAFPLREKAEGIVNRNQGKTSGSDGYEMIVAGVIADPGNPTRVYFATSAYDASTRENFVGIYGFDTKTLSWWRLYKNTFRQKDGIAPTLLHVVAHDGARLYVVEDRINTSHPPATPINDIGKILVFDFSHPESGFVTLLNPPEEITNITL